MNVHRLSLLVLIAALLPAGAEAAKKPSDYRRQAVAHYEKAKAHFGVAMGERGATNDPAMVILERSVADMVCLLGDADGCIEASKESGRRLGPYSEMLRPAKAASSLEAARAFLGELQRLSAGWGRDPSLASEGLGMLERAIGDRYRSQARAAAMPAYRRALKQARAGAPAARLKAQLTVATLAGDMLDQPKQARAALEIANLLSSGVTADDVPGGRAVLRAALDSGLAALRILGKDSETASIRKAIEKLETKAMTPPELAFEMGPGREKFISDLAAADRELGALAERAPLRSRASVLLNFLAAYAGVIDGRAQAAEQLAVLADVVAADDPYLAARIAGLRGRAALLTGDYYRAVKLLDDARRMLGGDKSLALLGGLMAANGGRALHYLGSYQKAAAHFEQAAGLLGDRKALVFDCLLGAAQAAGFAGDHQRAGQFLDRAQKTLGALAADRRGRAERRLAIDRALELAETDRREDATALLAKTAQAAAAAGEHVQAAIARTNLAELYNDAGESDKALEQAKAALAALGRKGSADAVWQAYTERARALSAQGKLKAAGRAYSKAIDLVESLRARIGAEGSRRSFSAAKTRLYRGAVALQAQLGHVGQAFRISERARGRAFLDMLGERELKLGDRQAEARLAPARRAMLHSLPPVKNVFAGPAAGMGGGRKSPADSKNAIKPNPRQGWISLVTVNPANVSDVKKALEPGETLVSFFHDGGKLQLFAITRANVKIAAVEVGERELHNLVMSFLRAVKEPGRGQARVKKKGLRLYRKILAPLGKALPRGKLIVVPWGPLHYVPFMALWDGDAYLVDRFDSISSVPSASSLCMIRARQRKAGGKVLALGDPKTDMPDLPTAVKEVKLVGSMFKNANVQIGTKASKRTFLADAAGAGMIHIASHGVFLPKQPMDSYLALSGDPPSRGRLSASEVLGVDLSRARLVVLSACDSGRAEIGAGEEVIGMTRAFLHAGSQALLATLWPLSDESAASIIEDFYTQIRKGSRPAEALTHAARKVKKDSRFAHPFFWAPFEVIGG